MRRKEPTKPKTQTTKSGVPYRAVRKLRSYVGSTKAKYSSIALPLLSHEVAA